MSDNIPNAHTEIIKDAGHFPHLEKPEIVNEALVKWRENKCISHRLDGAGVRPNWRDYS